MKRQALLVLLGVAALFYLIARPHVGTIYQERITIHVASPNPTSVLAADRFPTYEACMKQADDANSISAQTGDYNTCEAKTVLLWGW